jgi:hypothetical protein
MNPQQPVAPLPPPPPGGPMQPPHIPHDPYAADDPYRFIMEPPKRQKPKGTGLAGNPFLMKIVFFLGAAIVVIVAGAILVNVFFGGKTNTQDIVDIAATEQEIMRVSVRGADAANDSVKNAAITTQATVATEQQEWITYLAKLGKKTNAKQLALKKNTTTDSRLTQAQATSTFDLTFSQVMRSQLQDYASELKTAYGKATGKNEKALLSKHYDQVVLLLEQWPSKTDPNAAPAAGVDPSAETTNQ